jgi:hypothetical protein
MTRGNTCIDVVFTREQRRPYNTPCFNVLSHRLETMAARSADSRVFSKAEHLLNILETVTLPISAVLPEILQLFHEVTQNTGTISFQILTSSPFLIISSSCSIKSHRYNTINLSFTHTFLYQKLHLYWTYNWYNLQLKDYYTCSYMFRSVRTIFREPMSILAKITLHSSIHKILTMYFN